MVGASVPSSRDILLGVRVMVHPGLSPAASLGETEAGSWVAAPPWLGFAQ